MRVQGSRLDELSQNCDVDGSEYASTGDTFLSPHHEGHYGHIYFTFNDTGSDQHSWTDFFGYMPQRLHALTMKRYLREGHDVVMDDSIEVSTLCTDAAAITPTFLFRDTPTFTRKSRRMRSTLPFHVFTTGRWCCKIERGQDPRISSSIC